MIVNAAVAEHPAVNHRSQNDVAKVVSQGRPRINSPFTDRGQKANVETQQQPEENHRQVTNESNSDDSMAQFPAPNSTLAVRRKMRNNFSSFRYFPRLLINRHFASHIGLHSRRKMELLYS